MSKTLTENGYYIDNVESIVIRIKKVEKMKKIMSWIFVILWAGLIFFMSSMDTIESNGKSKTIINDVIEKSVLVINNKYYVEFKDVKNILNTVEVTEEQVGAFNEFELEDKSQMNKDERHKERSEVYEETLYKKANLIYDSVEDDFIKKI